MIGNNAGRLRLVSLGFIHPRRMLHSHKFPINIQGKSKTWKWLPEKMEDDWRPGRNDASTWKRDENRDHTLYSAEDPICALLETNGSPSLRRSWKDYKASTVEDLWPNRELNLRWNEAKERGLKIGTIHEENQFTVLKKSSNCCNLHLSNTSAIAWHVRYPGTYKHTTYLCLGRWQMAVNNRSDVCMYEGVSKSQK